MMKSWDAETMRVKGNDIAKESPGSLLLIQLGDIGDVVLTLPAVRALHEHFPGAVIVAAVREKARDVMDDCPWVAEVLSINEASRSPLDEIRYQWDFFARVRRFHFDLAVDVKAGNRSAILALLSGAKQRIGFYDRNGRLWQNRVFTHLVSPGGRPGRHMTEHYLGLMNAYGISTDRIWPEYHVPAERSRQVQRLFTERGVSSDRPVIAVQPFSLWKYKEWNAAKYVQLINWLISDYNVSVVITGSAGERARAEEILAHCPRNTCNLAGETSIGTLAAVLKFCSLFIGVDSAGIHIAAAVGIPTVGIFGPSSISDWAPRGPRHIMVYKDLPCLPCRNKGCDDSEVSRCLEELTLDEVKNAVAGQMRGIA